MVEVVAMVAKRSEVSKHNATRVRFKSVYRGVYSFEVLGGTMDGRRVSVYEPRVSWYEEAREDGSEFAGMVTMHDDAPSIEVLEAIQAYWVEFCTPENATKLWPATWDGSRYVQATADG